MATQTKPWTYEDYLKLEEDKRYELIEGELLEMPVPSVTHQRIGVCSFGYEDGRVSPCLLKNFEINLEELFKEV